MTSIFIYGSHFLFAGRLVRCWNLISIDILEFYANIIKT